MWWGGYASNEPSSWDNIKVAFQLWMDSIPLNMQWIVFTLWHYITHSCIFMDLATYLHCPAVRWICSNVPWFLIFCVNQLFRHSCFKMIVTILYLQIWKSNTWRILYSLISEHLQVWERKEEKMCVT